jgi:hypothetical protein
MTTLITQHLNGAVLRMKHQSDKKHSEHQFEKGELVFLKLHPYVQSSLAPRANQKLSFKFFGPFEILDRIGSVAYKLKLPEGCTIQLVFHVSQLMKALGVDVPVTTNLPSEVASWQVP